MREMILAEDKEARVKALAKCSHINAAISPNLPALDGLPRHSLLDPPLHEFLPHEQEQQPTSRKKIASRRTIARRVRELHNSIQVRPSWRRLGIPSEISEMQRAPFLKQPRSAEEGKRSGPES